jgi:hypothetical protein
VTVAAGQASATFTATAASVSSNTSSLISASYAGVTKSATLTVRKKKRAAVAPVGSQAAVPGLGGGR